MAVKQIYEPIYPEKYEGKYPITLKSSWEYIFAQNYCDLNTNCISWSYEHIKIPYKNPLTDKQTIYIPDFLMAYYSPDGHIETSLIEIKPLHESNIAYARSVNDAKIIAKNEAKWAAAKYWCERRNNVKFVLLTEANLFSGGDNINPKKKLIKSNNILRRKKI